MISKRLGTPSDANLVSFNHPFRVPHFLSAYATAHNLEASILDDQYSVQLSNNEPLGKNLGENTDEGSSSWQTLTVVELAMSSALVPHDKLRGVVDEYNIYWNTAARESKESVWRESSRRRAFQLV